MARFELHIEADSYGEFKKILLGVAKGITEVEKLEMIPLELSKREEKEAAVPKVAPVQLEKEHLPDPGVKTAPPLGSERKPRGGAVRWIKIWLKCFFHRGGSNQRLQKRWGSRRAQSPR